MTADTFRWLPVVLGSSALLAGGVGLLLCLLPSFQKRRHQLLKGSTLYLLAGTLFTLPTFGFVSQLINSPPTVTLALTSDPSGADVYSGDRFLGTTPLELSLAKDAPFTYQVRAGDSVSDKLIYQPFEGSMTLIEDTAISVWLDRQ